ncbi:putative glucose-methanol-choline oxidoreductase [Xylariaceae sp. FL0255]|nr:putative glucose-methanol-choline oxidoreductase [Xylariaceae sp. FL0255]
MYVHKIVSLLVLLASSAHSSPVQSPIEARHLLGNSFGIAGNEVTYDYIIIGGGTAGLTVATRLVESQAGSVAVIEAGTFYEIVGNTSEVPAYDVYYTSKGTTDWNPQIDWGYITTPQAGAYNESMHYPRGKMLGGSSGRNYMAYQRGSKDSYKKWADIVGDSTYEFDNLLPYFMKSVNFTGPSSSRFANSTPSYDTSTVGLNSASSPLSVTYPNYAQAFASWSVNGLKAIGLSVIDGFTSGKLLGQSYITSTINADSMHRESSETSFLRKGLEFPSLTIYQSTLAKKVIFEGETATGILVNTEGLQYTLSAQKEVILSAGAFGSPQLLMVSGVGPEATLKDLDIPIVANLPGVGQGMQDHILFGVTHRVNIPTFSALADPAFAAEQATLYEEAQGMYTGAASDVIGWEKVPSPLRSTLSQQSLALLDSFPSDWPELEYITLPAYLGDQWSLSSPADGNNYAALTAAIVAPLSRGYVSISSPDTAVQPIINPNFLTNQTDIEVAIAGFKRAREFWASDAMKPILIGEEAYPGANVTSDAEIEEVIRNSFGPVFHASCTCAMGKASDPMAVVDTQGLVYGVKGLRVVDASIFPLLPPGHPQSTVYALAEKIACDITGKC